MSRSLDPIVRVDMRRSELEALVDAVGEAFELATWRHWNTEALARVAGGHQKLRIAEEVTRESAS